MKTLAKRCLVPVLTMLGFVSMLTAQDPQNRNTRFGLPSLAKKDPASKDVVEPQLYGRIDQLVLLQLAGVEHAAGVKEAAGGRCRLRRADPQVFADVPRERASQLREGDRCLPSLAQSLSGNGC